jgi:aldehyde dehydrogenase (NAD+)
MRVAWAKFTNSGQICIAPDHVYVHESKVGEFKAGVLKALEKYYGPNATQSNDYVQLVHDRHLERIKAMGAEAATTGTPWTSHYGEEKDRKLAPMVVLNPDKESACMREEIFGPLLPVFSYSDIDEVLKEVNGREHPLVVYIYSKSQKNIRHIQNNTRAGATAVNMSLLQIANNNLPFGGIGHSGMGKTNGKAGFMEFTNTRSEFYQWGPPVNKLLSAPFTASKAKIVDLLIKYLY